MGISTSKISNNNDNDSDNDDEALATAMATVATVTEVIDDTNNKNIINNETYVDKYSTQYVFKHTLLLTNEQDLIFGPNPPSAIGTITWIEQLSSTSTSTSSSSST